MTELRNFIHSILNSKHMRPLSILQLPKIKKKTVKKAKSKKFRGKIVGAMKEWIFL